MVSKEKCTDKLDTNEFTSQQLTKVKLVLNFIFDYFIETKDDGEGNTFKP